MEAATLRSLDKMYYNYQHKNRNVSNNKTIRCKCCCRTRHTNSACPDKKRERPPSTPLWVSNAIYMKCKKKSLLSFNCPTKYAGTEVINPKESKYKMINRVSANKVEADESDTIKTVEFVDMSSLYM